MLWFDPVKYERYSDEDLARMAAVALDDAHDTKTFGASSRRSREWADLMGEIKRRKGDVSLPIPTNKS